MAEDQRKRIDAESSGQNSSLKTNTVTKAKRQPYSVQKATIQRFLFAALYSKQAHLLRRTFPTLQPFLFYAGRKVA